MANGDLWVRVTYFILLLHVLKFRVGFKLINKSAVLPFTRYLLYVVKNWSDDELDRELDIFTENLPQNQREYFIEILRKRC